MAEAIPDPSVVGKPELLAELAHKIITEQHFDYFDSRSAAREHGRLEGIDLRRLSKTPLGYTRLPRAYPPALSDSLDIAFAQLAEPQPEVFLHFDRYGVTLGSTQPDENRTLELIVSPAERSCSLRLESCDFVSFSFMPAQDTSGSMPSGSSEAVELPLGRNVLVGDYTEEEEIRALRDMHRDWERILVIGEAEAEEHLQIILDSPGPTESQSTPRRIAHGSIAVGALLASPIFASTS